MSSRDTAGSADMLAMWRLTHACTSCSLPLILVDHSKDWRVHRQRVMSISRRTRYSARSAASTSCNAGICAACAAAPPGRSGVECPGGSLSTSPLTRPEILEMRGAAAPAPAPPSPAPAPTVLASFTTAADTAAASAGRGDSASIAVGSPGAPSDVSLDPPGAAAALAAIMRHPCRWVTSSSRTSRRHVLALPLSSARRRRMSVTSRRPPPALASEAAVRLTALTALSTALASLAGE
mmetsp:Transcript_43169/g.137865  ORF Transcript_43169/g.137865 Transcript_43169/m.137865 type:complete len:237 (+) Transcript_43169:179-889(+)